MKPPSAGLAGNGYRWVILLAAFVVQMLAIGSTSFGYGLFVKPVAEEFGISRAQVNFGLTLQIIGMAIASPLVGRAFDRFPARRVLLAGAALFGTGTLAIAYSGEVWLMAVAIFFLVAPGAAALGPIMASTLVARWFDERRGRALGIVAIASSAGGLVVVPAMAYVIGVDGWRHSVLLTGSGIAAVTAVVALFAIRDRPIPVVNIGVRSPIDAPWTARKLLLTRDFWLLVLAVGMILAIAAALLSALIAFGTDSGYSLAQASGLVSAVSLSSVAGKILIGTLADTVDKRLLLACVAVMMEIFLLLLLAEPAYPMLLAGCLIAGMALGGATPIWAALISSRFGVTSFGMVMGLCVPMQMPLIVAAVQFIGESFDRTGNYNQAFLLFALLNPLALVAALALGRPDWRKL